MGRTLDALKEIENMTTENQTQPTDPASQAQRGLNLVMLEEAWNAFVDSNCYEADFIGQEIEERLFEDPEGIHLDVEDFLFIFRLATRALKLEASLPELLDEAKREASHAVLSGMVERLGLDGMQKDDQEVLFRYAEDAAETWTVLVHTEAVLEQVVSVLRGQELIEVESKSEPVRLAWKTVKELATLREENARLKTYYDQCLGLAQAAKYACFKARTSTPTLAVTGEQLNAAVEHFVQENATLREADKAGGKTIRYLERELERMNGVVAAMEADAELGRLLEKQRDRSESRGRRWFSLTWRCNGRWWVEQVPKGTESHDTPEAALRAALEVDEP